MQQEQMRSSRRLRCASGSYQPRDLLPARARLRPSGRPARPPRRCGPPRARRRARAPARRPPRSEGELKPCPRRTPHRARARPRLGRPGHLRHHHRRPQARPPRRRWPRRARRRPRRPQADHDRIPRHAGASRWAGRRGGASRGKKPARLETRPSRGRFKRRPAPEVLQPPPALSRPRRPGPSAAGRTGVPTLPPAAPARHAARSPSPERP